MTRKLWETEVQALTDAQIKLVDAALETKASRNYDGLDRA
jgi:hypothetical protein